MINLSNDSISLVLDEKRGTIVELKDTVRDWLISGEETPLFSLLVPLPGNALNELSSERQNPPEVLTNNKERVSLLWTSMKDNQNNVYNIGFTADITLTGPELIFEGTLENHSPYTVEHVVFPKLRALAPKKPDGTLTQMWWGYAGMNQTEIYPRFAGEYGYWASEFPYKQVSVPDSDFMLLQSEGYGLYFGCHDTRLDYRMEFFNEVKPAVAETMFWRILTPDGVPENQEKPEIDSSVIHLTFTQPGDSIRLLKSVLSPYTGQWEEGLKPYKEWRKEWYKPGFLPDWAKKVHAWCQVQMNSYGDGLRYRYTDIPKIGRICAEHNISVIQLTGWTIEGQDGRTPSHDIDPRLGTLEELKNAIAETEAMGVHVILYCKFCFADTRTNWFKKELYQYAGRDIFGDIHSFHGYSYERPSLFAGINTHRLAMMCQECDKWQGICQNELDHMLKLNASGILYDETHQTGSMPYCFDDSHGHSVPSYLHNGGMKLAKRLRDFCDASGQPEFIMTGEAIIERAKEFYPFSYFRIHGVHCPVQTYIDSTYANLVGVWGYNDRNTLNICLLNRYIISYEPRDFRGLPDEFPALIQYGSSIDSLRRRYSDQLWDIEMLPHSEISIRCEGPRPVYTLYRSLHTGKKTLMMANLIDNEMNVCVDSNLTWKEVRPEAPDAVDTGKVAHIPPRSALVWMEA